MFDEFQFIAIIALSDAQIVPSWPKLPPRSLIVFDSLFTIWYDELL